MSAPDWVRMIDAHAAQAQARLDAEAFLVAPAHGRRRAADPVVTTCLYCDLPTDDEKSLHPICELEVSDDPYPVESFIPGSVTSCPDDDPGCPACSPEAVPLHGRRPRESDRTPTHRKELES